MSCTEDLQRALSARGLAVAPIPGKGRGLFTTRYFSPGEIILCQGPYVATPNKFFVGTSCDGCFTSNNLRKCSVCRMAWYCGNNCQRSEWKLHQPECKAIAALSDDRKKMLTPTIRLMLRMVLKRKLQNEQVISTSETDYYELVNALESHMSDLDANQLMLYAQMANLVKLVIPSLYIDLKEITHNFSKLACNAHTICDAELRPLGTGLYPVISLVNHSCVPNSVLIFEGAVAYVRALEPIPNGTEVFISYIETAATTKRRQNDLKQYFFTCKCPRCLKNTYENLQEDVFLEGHRCKDQKCNGLLLSKTEKKAFECQQCGLGRDEQEVQRITSEIEQLTEKASTLLSAGNIHEACALYKTVEQIECKFYRPFSVNLLQTRETLLKIFMEIKDWQAALTYCKLTLPAYQRIYPAIHPMVGLQFYTCGKLEWLLGRTEAVKSYTKAADILRITHGTKTPFMRELLGQLEEAEAEASLKLSSRS